MTNINFHPMIMILKQVKRLSKLIASSHKGKRLDLLLVISKKEMYIRRSVWRICIWKLGLKVSIICLYLRTWCCAYFCTVCRAGRGSWSGYYARGCCRWFDYLHPCYVSTAAFLRADCQTELEAHWSTGFLWLRCNGFGGSCRAASPAGVSGISRVSAT